MEKEDRLDEYADDLKKIEDRINDMKLRIDENEFNKIEEQYG